MMEAKFYCAFCQRENILDIDPSEGFDQRFEEECEFCDHPNYLDVEIDRDTMDIEVESRCEE